MKNRIFLIPVLLMGCVGGGGVEQSPFVDGAVGSAGKAGDSGVRTADCAAEPLPACTAEFQTCTRGIQSIDMKIQTDEGPGSIETAWMTDRRGFVNDVTVHLLGTIDGVPRGWNVSLVDFTRIGLPLAPGTYPAAGPGVSARGNLRSYCCRVDHEHPHDTDGATLDFVEVFAHEELQLDGGGTFQAAIHLTIAGASVTVEVEFEALCDSYLSV